MKCPYCCKKMDCTTGEYKYTESGLDNIYLLGVEICKCSCGEVVASIPSINELHNLLGRRLINKDTPLIGREIKFLRKNIGFSGKEFAEVIGIDKSTLSRWENNAQPISNSHDRLIRLTYSNFKGIPKKEIEELMKDKFKQIKRKEKLSPSLKIPRNQWATAGCCPA